MWQQEGEGPPRQRAGGKACTAAPASTEPERGAPARGWALDAGTEHTPRLPALLPQPSPSPASPPPVCTHRLPRLYWGQRQPMGPFIAVPHCDTAPVVSQAPERITGQPHPPSPARELIMALGTQSLKRHKVQTHQS